MLRWDSAWAGSSIRSVSRTAVLSGPKSYLIQQAVGRQLPSAESERLIAFINMIQSHMLSQGTDYKSYDSRCLFLLHESKADFDSELMVVRGWRIDT